MDNIDIITIIDDNEESALQSKYLVEDLDIDVLLITKGKFLSIRALQDEIFERTKGRKLGVLCDHRLQHSALANFHGSALVASLYKIGIPAILLTQFASTDVDTTIREYRRWMPVMIPRDQLTIDAIPEGFQKCISEFSGQPATSRVPFRTLVEIIGTHNEGNCKVAEAFVPGWNPDRAVKFPLALIENKGLQTLTIQTVRSKGIATLFAEVNIGSQTASELFFTSFEWAPEPAESPLDNLYKLL